MENFDPENIQHWTWFDEGTLDSDEVVCKSDYDKLLALYRQLKAKEDAQISIAEVYGSIEIK